MERKIGEIFTYNGKMYQVAKSDICENCAFRLDSLFGLFIIGVFILLADYIIFDIIS